MTAGGAPRGRFRPSLRLTLAALPVFVLLCGLGTWQVRRMGEAREVQALMDERVAAPSLGEADLGPEPPDPGEVDFRRVVLEGRWDWDRTLVVGRQYWLGIPGYRLVVPFEWRPGPGGTVLVDRGFVPRDGFDEALSRARAEAAGPVELRGLARDASEWFPEAAATDSQDLGGRVRRWNHVAPIPMARALGIEDPGWFVREGERQDDPPRGPPPSWPAPGWTSTHQGRPHLQYALTWYGLALALLGTWTGMARRGGHGRDVGSRPGPRG